MLKKIFKWILIVILSFIFLIFISLLTFKFIFSQRKIETVEINSPDVEKHILIASQGSNFKDRLNKILLDELKVKNPYIKVIDVSLLEDIKSSDWESIIIINSIESGKMQKNVVQFIQKNNTENNIILINTSGSGRFELNDYDAISTASKIENLDNIIKQIIDRINPMI